MIASPPSCYRRCLFSVWLSVFGTQCSVVLCIVSKPPRLAGGLSSEFAKQGVSVVRPCLHGKENNEPTSGSTRQLPRYRQGQAQSIMAVCAVGSSMSGSQCSKCDEPMSSCLLLTRHRVKLCCIDSRHASKSHKLRRRHMKARNTDTALGQMARQEPEQCSLEMHRKSLSAMRSVRRNHLAGGRDGYRLQEARGGAMNDTHETRTSQQIKAQNHSRKGRQPIATRTYRDTASQGPPQTLCW